jgi:hypothetical protein
MSRVNAIRRNPSYRFNAYIDFLLYRVHKKDDLNTCEHCSHYLRKNQMNTKYISNI